MAITARHYSKRRSPREPAFPTDLSYLVCPTNPASSVLIFDPLTATNTVRYPIRIPGGLDIHRCSYDEIRHDVFNEGLEKRCPDRHT